MKKHFLLSLFLGLAVLLTVTSCKDDDDDVPPASVVAKFTLVSNNDFIAPTEITFTNASVIPTEAGTATYAWDFGDGNTSTDKDPVHTYTDAGNYTIKLVVSTTNADDAEYTEEITVQSGVIFEEDFEGYSPDATTGAYLPNDWVVLDIDGGVPNDVDMYDAGWKIATSTVFGSDIAVATSYYDDPYPTADDWMITPKISIENSTFLSWDAMSLTSSGNYPDSYQVYVSTTTQDKDGCTNGTLVKEVLDETWEDGLENDEGVLGKGIQSYEVDLSNFAGQDVYIGFRLITPDAMGSELGVDNIKVFKK